ncbi:dienelactone hydrolase family protein [Hoyosella rhizosphaerae]|uniref:dienelactone hydrolase family protein n=1 Tax=Hoyosella rhizosphaerae TaxID=1755582 RepID=UPI003557E59A
MSEFSLHTSGGDMTAYLFHPESSSGPLPGVVVVHDAIGLSDDTKDICQRVADQGYVVVAPDLFSRGGDSRIGKMRCVRRVFKDLIARRGQAVDDLLAAREFLLQRDDCTGAVGIVGFCMGGGFALVMAPKGFDASAPFYGVVPKGLHEALDGACPVVASFGKRDPLLPRGEKRLVKALEAHGVEYDVKTYPGVGHSFVNKLDYGPATPLLKVTGFHYGAEAADDAWKRVFAFFDKHLSV